MGKDKEKKEKSTKRASGDTGCFTTKESLQDYAIHLTRQIFDLEKRYLDIYQHVQALNRTYQDCKEHVPMLRYGELKRMIKACVTDELRHKAANYNAEDPQEKGGVMKLLTAARQFSNKSAEAAAAVEEVSKLHKAELKKDIEEKEQRKEKLELRFLRLHNRLEKLKADYEHSKEYIPTKRYLVMKEMIKPLIRDETLKVD